MANRVYVPEIKVNNKFNFVRHNEGDGDLCALYLYMSVYMN